MLEDILLNVKNGSLSIEQAKHKLASFENLGFAKVDHHRRKRQGFPEVIYGEGKTSEQIIKISNSLLLRKESVLITRVTSEKAASIISGCPELKYEPQANLLYWSHINLNCEEQNGYIAVIAAGTSDLKVAEEAVITAQIMGSAVRRYYDVGVAGIHRLLHYAEEIQNAKVSVVVAGMEGALPSVVGGLVAHPVIAVPTSIGYGANFSGLSALLTMLNSCASGISVVNIDNGFGGGYNAAMIHQSIINGGRLL